MQRCDVGFRPLTLTIFRGGRIKMRVLVVVPNEKTRGQIVRNLDVLGYNSFETESGNAAAEFVRGKNAVDLVIASLAIPLVRGKELAQIVKASAIKMIVLCKGSDMERRRAVTAAGVDLLLPESVACQRVALEAAINSLFPPKP